MHTTITTYKTANQLSHEAMLLWQNLYKRGAYELEAKALARWERRKAKRDKIESSIFGAAA